MRSQTGLKSEKQFVEYIGKTSVANAIGMADRFKALKEQMRKEAAMNVVRN